jgi:hypothetical protein
VDSGLSWSGLLVRTPRRLGRCARPRRCCGPRTVFRPPRSLVGARPRRSLSVGGVAGSPRREPLRWGASGRGVAALLCSATMLWKRSCMTGCTRCPRTALRAGRRGRLAALRCLLELPCPRPPGRGGVPALIWRNSGTPPRHHIDSREWRHARAVGRFGECVPQGTCTRS